MSLASLPLFQTDLFIPAYRPLAVGNWELRHGHLNLVPGYWSDTVLVQGMAALIRDGHTWMSMTPFELESQEVGVRLAYGHVLIFGLGMGWSAVVSALRPEVQSVTVVEFDPDVLAMHRELDIFSQLPDSARAKLRLLQGDAYAYRPDRAIHVFMPDIWLPLMNDGRVAEVQAMQSRVEAERVYFWGQEMELARAAIAAGRALDHAGIAATSADFGLPLLGLELPDYPQKLERAARRWLGDRWLPGTVPAW